VPCGFEGSLEGAVKRFVTMFERQSRRDEAGRKELPEGLANDFGTAFDFDNLEMATRDCQEVLGSHRKSMKPPN
jgi:hypothetical protein